MEKKVYMIGNAHLDPVWMWQWQEGCSEAKATVRSALDRMKEFPDFTFTCGAAVIYKWIEELCPDMFEEIKARVAEGRWRVVGGWWVQPDCNLPSGESFVRHGLYSQRFFKEKLGVTSKVGYNVDSFGHNNNLPQILKKSGMDSYVFMRPMKHEKHMDSNIFEWESPDGSRVTTYRIPHAYCCDFNTKDELDRHIDRIIDECDPSIKECMGFYGVGNHGGGPTKKNIGFIKELQAAGGDRELVFSSPEEFFADIKAKGYKLQVHKDDLQHHASGCYAAYSRIKQLNRLCETRLVAAEKFAVQAHLKTGMAYPNAELLSAWEKALFIQFHDSLGGCSIEPVYPEMDQWAEKALCIASDISNASLQRLAWNTDTSGCPEGFSPIVVFNPHTWEVKQTIRVNNQSDTVLDSDGARVDSQFIQSWTKACYGRWDTVFEAVVPAMGYKVYYTGNSGNISASDNAPKAEGLTLENKYLKVLFEGHTGYIQSLYDKENGRELLSGKGCVPVVADEFYHDTWSHGLNFFNDFIARFSDAEIKVLENGPVRAVIKVTSRYNKSTLIQKFALSASSHSLEVDVKLDWQEHHKALKLEVPVNVKDTRVFYETAYSHIERPCDGEEEPSQMWTALTGSDKDSGQAHTLALLNDSKYSFSADGNVLRMMMVRSPIFGDHGNVKNEECSFTDQGVQHFKYSILPSAGQPSFGGIARAAQELNTPLTYIFESVHGGKQSPVSYGASVSGFNGSAGDNVILSVIKKAEDGVGYVVRLYETDGRDAEVMVDLPFLKHKFSEHFKPFEIKSFRIANEAVTEILMTELAE